MPNNQATMKLNVPLIRRKLRTYVSNYGYLTDYFSLMCVESKVQKVRMKNSFNVMKFYVILKS